MGHAARRITAGLLAVALLLVVAGSAPAEGPDPEPSGITPPRLSYVDGQVGFWRPGSEDWTAAQLNMALAPGDQLHTGRPGNVELQIGPAAFVRAWGDTEFGLAGQTPDLLQLKVTDGHVAVDARALDSGRVIRIETPGSAFTIERPGYYRVDVGPEGASFITRRSSQATLTRVDAGGAQVYGAPEPDVWDRWNQTRTDELLQPASARYVPEGLYGVRELDQHGDWRVLPTYGAVWVPRGSPAGWAPYTTGRWAWDPRFGWTWVDSAVWGWAPYHHGRWVYLDGVWAWAPGPVIARPVYAPALVAFFSAPGVRVRVGSPFVSWVALGWGEPLVPWWGRSGFVGRPTWGGWGGPHVVNNVVVHRTTVVYANDIRVYRNAGVHRAVVAVHPERFGRARVQDVRVTEIDTRRLEPVRGPLRAVPDSARRGEPSGRAHRTPDAEQPRPAAAPRPAARTENPAPTATPGPRPDAAPRSEPGPRVPHIGPGSTPAAGGEAPRERRRESAPPRVEGGSSPEGAPAAAPRSERVPRSEPSRPEMRPRLEPVRPDMRQGAEPSRRGMPARAESWPADARPRAELPRPEPRLEPARPQMSPRVDRPRPAQRDAADRAFRGPGRVDRREARRAPAASSPSLTGAASHDGQGRGAGRDRAR
jgi:hypothetical protein